MTTPQLSKIKADANKAFSSSDYKLAFAILCKLPINDFIVFAIKKGYVSKGNSAKYFWNTFFPQEQILKVFLSSNEALELINIYFSNHKWKNKALELQIASLAPKLYVESIKKQQVFFKPLRINFICDEVNLPQELKIHQIVWRQFYNDEYKLWKILEGAAIKLKTYKLSEILTSLILTIENINYNDNSQQQQQDLGDCYSFFIELILKSNFFSENDITSKNMRDGFISNVSSVSTTLSELINELFQIIYARNRLFSVYIDPYCFDNDFKPTLINKTIRFLTTPQSHYKWKEDGFRYRINEVIYQQRAINKHPTELMLEDLGINHYYFNKKSTDLSLVVPPIYNLSKQYFRFYESEISNYKTSFNNWLDAFKDYSQKIAPKFFVPFLAFTKEELTTVYKKDKSEAIVFVLQWSMDKSKFNRFNVNYNVFKKPFLKINDCYFCPSLFFTSFTGVYSFVTALLYNNNSKERETAKGIESNMLYSLRKHNWQAFIPKNENIKGDADIILFDDESLILMQLKRTFLRLDSKSSYEETIKVDHKASKQLNECEVFLKAENKVFNIENRRIYKWIVSTSFESVNTTINGCKKVSYFDIIHILSSNEQFKNIKLFIDYVEHDRLFKNTFKENKLSIKLDEINHYNLDYVYTANAKSNKLIRLFNKGLDLNKEGKHLQSLELLKECLKIEDKNVETHSAIANVYGDIGEFTTAETHFKKALRLLPNDPFISRNYAGLLFEKGKFKQALNKCLELIKQYPLIDELDEQFDRLFLVASYNKLLDFNDLKKYSIERLEMK